MVVAGWFIGALGLWVFLLEPRKPMNQAFGAFLGLAGIIEAFDFGGLFSRDLDRAFRDTADLLALLLPLASLFFFLTWRERYAPVREKAVILWVVGAASIIAVAVNAYYQVVHSSTGPGGDLIVTACAGLGLWVCGLSLFGKTPYGISGIVAGFALGISAAVATSVVMTFALFAVLLALDYARNPADPRRRPLLWLSTGLGLYPFYLWSYSMLSPHSWPHYLEVILDPHEYGFARAFGEIVDLVVFFCLWVGPALILTIGAHRSTDPAIRRDGWRAAAIFAMAWAPPTLYIGLQLDEIGRPLGDRAYQLLPSGVGDILIHSLTFVAGAVLTGYAVVRHQVFDIDRKMRRLIGGSAIAAVFVAGAFVAVESVQVFFGEKMGAYAGIVAAGLIALLIHPLQRFGRRVAAIVIRADPITNDQREAVYIDQLFFAWADGFLTPRERMRLEALRNKLGLSEADVSRLESGVLRSIRGGDEAAAPSATPSPAKVPSE